MLRTAVPIFVCFALFGLVASQVFKQKIAPVVAVLDQPDQPPQPPEQPKGKLVVLVVFDQMRGDYLSRWAEHFGSGGFERLKREGVWYSDVQIPYACASTGPGHASLATGAPPSVTGIIENEWWDRNEAKRVYCCQPFRPYDLVPPPPADSGKTGRGADTGFSPERLLAETVGDKLKAVAGGKGRVFSLSIKDRTAVLMGGQKPDAAYCFDTR
ncbi:MAG: alkaline phosphatase family protein, partial [Gemmataceae bacterium]